VPGTWRARLVFAVAAAFASASLLSARAPAIAEPQASLAGQLLIATPSMGDPRFAQTVILMVRHDKDGAFGLVINRPIAERPLAELLDMLGDKDAPVSGNIRIFAGGPVQPELGFVLHSAEYRAAQTIVIDGRMAVTSSRELLRDIGNGKGPAKSLFVFGYSGWAPGQLEGELKQKSWVTAPADGKLVFDEDRDKLWDIAYAQRTQDL
jgi:putative transcriptional regulator